MTDSYTWEDCPPEEKGRGEDGNERWEGRNELINTKNLKVLLCNSINLNLLQINGGKTT